MLDIIKVCKKNFAKYESDAEINISVGRLI